MTLDDFWHQSRIICALLAGDKNNARFAADILKASGGEDVNFFQLVDKLLGSEAEISLDLATLDSVDLVLMDAAHEQISLAAFEQMPSSMIQAASNFRYLAADAALKTSFMMLERGLQNAAQLNKSGAPCWKPRCRPKRLWPPWMARMLWANRCPP